MNVGVRERLELMQAKLPSATQVSCLGMTESTGSMCIGEQTDSLELRTTTSGRPLTGMELKIVDGELLFRGPTAFSGYYRDPENTAQDDHRGRLGPDRRHRDAPTPTGRSRSSGG